LQYSDLPSSTQGPTAGPVVRGTTLPDLARLYEPEVMLVMAPIEPSAAALAHAEALGQAGPRSWTAEVATPEGEPLTGALVPLALEADADAAAWVAYVEEAVRVFAQLLGAEAVGVRQVVADGPHCPRFHVDRVVARGVLNVLGAPTEWLDDRDIDRARLGHAGGPDDATSGLVRSWDRLGRSDGGHLAIFKGTAWPGASDHAIVHRSPPPNGQRRVVLTLDWLE